MLDTLARTVLWLKLTEANQPRLEAKTFDKLRSSIPRSLRFEELEEVILSVIERETFKIFMPEGGD